MTGMINPILQFIELGGPVVAILLFLSVAAFALIGLKAIAFFNCKVGMHGNADKALALWKQRNRSQAIGRLKGTKSALGKTLLVSMEQISQGKTYKEDIEDEVAGVAIRELHELQRGFRTLEAIAQIAPLLGLFGTVLGMIDAFQKLQSAGNSVDPSILAVGIWVALLTTAAGLAVAMPVSLVLTWFETRLEDERVAIQSMNADLISTNISFDQETAGVKQSEPGVVYAH
ncbi:MAG: MotA/TolQ/ExbB proton channel family protein [Pseudomonadota bacterium]